MTGPSEPRGGGIGRPWLALCFALAVHAADEAHTGLLPVYDDAVRAVHELFPFVQSPSLALAAGMWASVGFVAGLTALMPFAYQGSVWMRRATMGVALVALANVTGHLGGALLAGRVMPGVYTTPLLAVVGVYALVRAWRYSPGCDDSESVPEVLEI